MKKIGTKSIEIIKKVYEAKTLSAASYGAAVWGISDISKLQLIEDGFLKNLISLPQSCSNYICHMELRVPYITDKIWIAPILMCYSVWRKETLSLTRAIINDSLNYVVSSLPLCPCYKRLSQNDLHFLFFCKFYETERKRCIVPLIRKINFRQCCVALYYLLSLPDPFTCFCLASFFLSVLNRMKLNLLQDFKI